MLNINIICVGKLKEKYLKDALNEYIKRLSRYCKLTITELPDEKIPDKLNPNLEIDIKTKESNNIINHIKKDSYIIALDLTGKQFTSEEFSKKIEDEFLFIDKNWPDFTEEDLNQAIVEYQKRTRKFGAN